MVKNHQNNSGITETGISILFLSTSWVEENWLKFCLRLEFQDIYNGNVIYFIIQLLMEHMFYKIRKVVSFLRVEWKLQKFQLQPKKPWLQIWWVCSKKDASKNSLKASKTSNKEIQKLIKVLNPTSLLNLCLKNSVLKLILSILLDMQ